MGFNLIAIAVIGIVALQLLRAQDHTITNRSTDQSHRQQQLEWCDEPVTHPALTS